VPLPPRAGSRSAVASVALAAAALVAGCTASVVTGHGSADRAPASSTPAGGPSTSGPTLPGQPPADFVDCSDRINVGLLGLPADRAKKLSFECATISVPLDYADPTGQKISLQLLRVHDSDDAHPTGSLLVNPGGPGGSGVELALGIAGQVSDALLRHFDLVGFDPRGVGLSTPITCLSDAQKDRINAASPDVRTAAGFAEAKRLAKEIADACSQKYGSALKEYNTVQTAMDMDQIRQAVGDSRMNYLGFSYGTKLGAQYIHMFPGRVRVAVLDGAVDPLLDDITSFADQVQGFEDAFDQFAAWCKDHSPCRELGNPRQTVYSVVADARRSPIPSSAPGETRKATPSIVYTGVLSALYSQSQWSKLGQGLIDAEHGDAKVLFELADQYNQRYGGHYTNISEANTTINCNDSKPGPSDATIRSTAASWAQKYPMFGLWSAAGLFSCQQWQPDRTVPPLPTAPSTPRKVLVVGNLHDPATPYQGAKDLTKTLGNAELLTWDGEGHTSYLNGSSCIDDAVNEYLIDETLPSVGKTCPR
jgi:pimeloyl-ACP methyl ester carboxylesterase